MSGSAQRTGRIRRASEFEQALAAPSCARSEHFVIHHLPLTPTSPARGSRVAELSTGSPASLGAVVDDWAAPAAAGPAAAGATEPAKPAARTTRLWLGLVVPKRHARRSVTRQLVRRQIRACFEGAADRLDTGVWIVRLRAPFDRQRFASAASAALRAAVRSELTDAFARASSAPGGPPDAPTA